MTDVVATLSRDPSRGIVTVTWDSLVCHLQVDVSDEAQEVNPRAVDDVIERMKATDADFRRATER